MNSLFFSLLFILAVNWGFSQPAEFSCINDRVFNKIESLYGYTFIPAKGKLSTSHFPIEIEKGMAVFQIEPTRLTVTESVSFSPAGRERKKEEIYKMDIVRLDTTSYGYQIVAADHSDADVQGYLKIYLNDKREVESLIFKAEPAYAEIVYYLPPLNEDYVERDALFYTHRLDHPASTFDKLIGTVLVPFAVLTESDDFYTFKRIYPSDYTRVYIEERTRMRGKKEIKEQFVLLKEKSSNKLVAEFIVKKVRALPKGDRPKKLEVEVGNTNRITSSQKDYITINLTPELTLASIEFSSLGKKYLMRRGKRKIK